MKKLRILSTALAMAALLTTQALAVPAAELVRVFAAGDALYTYVSITGAEAPITKAEAKLGQRSFPASGPLETVRQAGFPVEYLLLVDNSNSMPPFREEVFRFCRRPDRGGRRKYRLRVGLLWGQIHAGRRGTRGRDAGPRCGGHPHGRDRHPAEFLNCPGAGVF